MNGGSGDAAGGVDCGFYFAGKWPKKSVPHRLSASNIVFAYHMAMFKKMALGDGVRKGEKRNGVCVCVVYARHVLAHIFCAGENDICV